MSMTTCLLQEFQVNDCVAYAAKGPLDNLTVSGTMVCLASAAKEEPFEGLSRKRRKCCSLTIVFRFFCRSLASSIAPIDGALPSPLLPCQGCGAVVQWC